MSFLKENIWFFVALILFSSFVFGGEAADKEEERNFNFSSEREKLEELIHVHGGEEAYILYKKEFKNSSFGVQHTAAHLMGELLYENFGIDGLSICDANFAFGCFHGFFGLSIPTEGVSVIKSLDEVCVKAFPNGGKTACQHGIGHGVMEHVGTDIDKALTLCDRYSTQPNPIAGCTTGVFMEYYTPLSVDVFGVYTVKALDIGENPYGTCASVEEKFKEACYFSLPQWWGTSLSFNDIGILCESVDDYLYRKSCYIGVGNIAPSSAEYSAAETKKKCELMPTQTGKVLCTQMASWSFGLGNESEYEIRKICSDLSNEERKGCANYE